MLSVFILALAASFTHISLPINIAVGSMFAEEAAENTDSECGVTEDKSPVKSFMPPSPANTPT